MTLLRLAVVALVALPAVALATETSAPSGTGTEAALEQALADAGVLPEAPGSMEDLFHEVEDEVVPGEPAGIHTVRLHRQRVPVKGPGGGVSYKSVYFGIIYIGGPEPQEFSVVYDTGSGHVIVPSMSCSSPTCQIHRRYNREKSLEAQDVDYDGTVVLPGSERDQITIAFGTGEVTGEFVQDSLCLGTERRISDKGAWDMDCVSLRVVAATAMTDDPFQAFAFDGVLGLSLASLALSPEFSFFGQMVEQKRIVEPSFGVFLGDDNGEPSEICFGGHNPDRVSSPISWTPVVKPELGYWQVKVLELRVGDQVIDFCADGTCRAVVDTGTSLLAVPKVFTPTLQRLLERPEEQAAEVPVPCRGSSMPPLIFVLEGMEVHLMPEDYGRQPVAPGQNINTGACRPALMPIELPEPLGPKLFIWGEPVLRKYYTVYHWKDHSVGFAHAKHGAKEDMAEVGGTPAVVHA